ncbi:hypothetical protein DACRYDRAFT_19194 [Dacryopinax primogenitus]|uniref:Uncharacterized protein n=1 Tax=Dacryopinax primogenitus (strain DJM 731) TaxID=1858805 RepID=M5FTQ1_DACPD|nr:uncharacterized protein DACRYDRAFT_19194 [Dacryopinax primogenitus]EJT96611.1 hypothetical protein DACRYDRAFT_19194 [Dacryopinax primogenitus]
MYGLFLTFALYASMGSYVISPMVPTLEDNILTAGLLSGGATWAGTAPVCEGECNPGELQIFATPDGTPTCLQALLTIPRFGLMGLPRCLPSGLVASSERKPSAQLSITLVNPLYAVIIAPMIDTEQQVPLPMPSCTLSAPQSQGGH